MLRVVACIRQHQKRGASLWERFVRPFLFALQLAPRPTARGVPRAYYLTVLTGSNNGTEGPPFPFPLRHIAPEGRDCPSVSDFY